MASMLRLAYDLIAKSTLFTIRDGGRREVDGAGRFYRTFRG